VFSHPENGRGKLSVQNSGFTAKNRDFPQKIAGFPQKIAFFSAEIHDFRVRKRTKISISAFKHLAHLRLLAPFSF